jgi:integrase
MVVPLNRATLISVKHSAPDNSTKGQLQALGQKPPHKQTLPLVHEQREAGLPPDCRPHGLRKTFGRLLADAGATAHETMAALSHLTLAEAERYTREADRSGGRRSIVKPNLFRQFGETGKNQRKFKMKRRSLALPRGDDERWQKRL